MEFVDHAADAGADDSDAVHVDHVWTGCGAIPIAAEPAYDFAIASQVAQYVPNLLGWLRGIFTVLRPGGVLNLSLPDRRFMFDIKRKVSTLGELLEAYYLDFSRPSLRQVVDHTYGATLVDPARLWNEDVSPNDLPPLCGEYALALAHDQGRRKPRSEKLRPLSLLGLYADIVSRTFWRTSPGLGFFRSSSVNLRRRNQGRANFSCVCGGMPTSIPPRCLPSSWAPYRTSEVSRFETDGSRRDSRRLDPSLASTRRADKLIIGDGPVCLRR